MITLTLAALAVGWLLLLNQYPWLFAPRKSALPARYHYNVSGTNQPLPTWKRKEAPKARPTVPSR